MAAVELLPAGCGAARRPAAAGRDVRQGGLARVRRGRAALTAEADFVVIGAGAAGCAAARALVDGTEANVTLLESGGTNARDIVRDPTRGREVRNSDAGWRYQTVPQAGTNGRVHEWPFGRLIGGSTTLNGMIWTRGAMWDYDG